MRHEEIRDRIRDSRYWLGVYDRQEVGTESARWLFELGCAVMYDKPLFLLVQTGVELPAYLVRLARRILWAEVLDDGAVEFAVQEIVKELRALR